MDMQHAPQCSLNAKMHAVVSRNRRNEKEYTSFHCTHLPSGAPVRTYASLQYHPA